LFDKLFLDKRYFERSNSCAKGFLFVFAVSDGSNLLKREKRRWGTEKIDKKVIVKCSDLILAKESNVFDLKRNTSSENCFWSNIVKGLYQYQ